MKENLELAMLVISIFGAFYKLTKIEQKINENVLDARKDLDLMVQEYKGDLRLINYQLSEIKKTISDITSTLKRID